MKLIVSSAKCGFEDWNTIWGDPLYSGSAKVMGYMLASILLLRGQDGQGSREKLL